jgi:hypothetical protein
VAQRTMPPRSTPRIGDVTDVAENASVTDVSGKPSVETRYLRRYIQLRYRTHTERTPTLEAAAAAAAAGKRFYARVSESSRRVVAFGACHSV